MKVRFPARVARIRRTVRILAVFREHRICVFNILEFFGSGDKNADKGAMGSIASLSSGYLQSILSNVLQTTGLTGTTKNTQNSGALSSAQQMDNTQLSPFAQVTSELQQLQQSNPTEYRQVTQQIATNLQTAAAIRHGERQYGGRKPTQPACHGLPERLDKRATAQLPGPRPGGWRPSPSSSPRCFG